MVSRKRDYAAERARRNARARALGFSSHDALTRARKAGLVPSAAEVKKNPALAEKVAPPPKKQRAPRVRTPAEARKHDAESQRWSDKFSRQPETVFNKRWSAARKESYYQAFVRWFNIPGDERNFDPTYEYLLTYADREPQEFEGNPYAG